MRLGRGTPDHRSADQMRRDMLKQFRESGVVVSWRWSAAYDRNTCLTCLALDGEVFSIKKDLPKCHDGCRCVMLGILDTDSAKPEAKGATWFAKQSEKTQRDMLGSSEAFDVFVACNRDLKVFVSKHAKLLPPHKSR